MENASKALIIAGAILISILLISVGILIINSTRGTTDSAKTAMSDLEIMAFNSKFLPYEGSNKSSREINELLDTVIFNNASTSNKVVIKLYNLYGSYAPRAVIDSASFSITDSETGSLIQCNADDIRSLDEIKSILNQHLNNKYFNVSFYYFGENVYTSEEFNALPRVYISNLYSINKMI